MDDETLIAGGLLLAFLLTAKGDSYRSTRRREVPQVGAALSDALASIGQAEREAEEAQAAALDAGQDAQTAAQWQGASQVALERLNSSMEELNKIVSSLTGEVDAQGNPISTFRPPGGAGPLTGGSGQQISQSVQAVTEMLGYIEVFSHDFRQARARAAVLEAEIYEAAANLVEDRFRLVDLVVNSEKGIDLSKESTLALFLDIDPLYLKIGIKPVLAEMMNFLNGANNASRYDWIKEATSITDPYMAALVRHPSAVAQLFTREQFVPPAAPSAISEIGYSSIREFNADSRDPRMFSQIAISLIRDPEYGTRGKDAETAPLFQACTVPFTGGVTFSSALTGASIDALQDALTTTGESPVDDLLDLTDSRSHELLRDFLESTDLGIASNMQERLRVVAQFISPFREGMNEQATWVSKIHDTWRIIASFLWDERHGHDTIDLSGVTSSAVESRATVLELAAEGITQKIDELAAVQRTIEAKLNGAVPLLLALVDHLDKVSELDVKRALESFVGPQFVALALSKISNVQAVAAYNFVSEEESENLGTFGNLRPLFGGVVTTIITSWDRGVRGDLQKMTKRVNDIQEHLSETYFRFAKIVDAAQAAVIFTGPTDIEMAAESDISGVYPDPTSGLVRVAKKFGFDGDGERPDARIYGGELQSEPNTPPIIYNNTGSKALRGTKRKYIRDEIHQITEAQNANWQNPGYEISDFVLSGEPQNEGMLKWWGIPLAHRFNDAANDRELSSVPMRQRFGCNWLAKLLNYMEGDQRLTNLHGPVISNFLARTAKLQRVWAGLSSRFHASYIALRQTLFGIDNNPYEVLYDPTSVEGFNDLHSLVATRLAAEEEWEREQVVQAELEGNGVNGLGGGNVMPKQIDLGRRVCPCNVENYYYPDEEEDPMNLTEAMALATSPMIDFGAEPMAAIPALNAIPPEMPDWIEPVDQMADVSWQKGGKNWASVNQGFPQRRFIKNPYWLDLQGGAVWNLAKGSPIPPPQKGLGSLGGGALGGGDLIQIAGMLSGIGSGSFGDLGSNYQAQYLYPPSGGGAGQQRARIARNWSQGIPEFMDELLPIVEDGIDLDLVSDRPRWPPVVLNSLAYAVALTVIQPQRFPAGNISGGLESNRIKIAAYILQKSLKTDSTETTGFNLRSYQRVLALALAFQSKLSLPAKLYLAFMPKTNRQDSGYGNPEVNYLKWVGYPFDYLRGSKATCTARGSSNPDNVDNRYCQNPIKYKVSSWFREHVVTPGQPHHTALLKYVMQYEYEALLDLKGEAHADGTSNPFFRISDINGWHAFYAQFDGVKTDIDGDSFFRFFKVDEDTLRGMYDLTAAEASFLAVRATDLADAISDEEVKTKQAHGGRVPLIGQTPSGASVSGAVVVDPPQDDFDGETALLLGLAAAAAKAIAAGVFQADPQAAGSSGGSGGGGSSGGGSSGSSGGDNAAGLGDDEGEDSGGSGGTIWERGSGAQGAPQQADIKAWCEANDPTGTYPECKPYKKASSGGGGGLAVAALIALGLYGVSQS